VLFVSRLLIQETELPEEIRSMKYSCLIIVHLKIPHVQGPGTVVCSDLLIPQIIFPAPAEPVTMITIIDLIVTAIPSHDRPKFEFYFTSLTLFSNVISPYTSLSSVRRS
jgi:hypothetical protein